MFVWHVQIVNDFFDPLFDTIDAVSGTFQNSQIAFNTRFLESRSPLHQTRLRSVSKSHPSSSWRVGDDVQSHKAPEIKFIIQQKLYIISTTNISKYIYFKQEPNRPRNHQTTARGTRKGRLCKIYNQCIIRFHLNKNN